MVLLSMVSTDLQLIGRCHDRKCGGTVCGSAFSNWVLCVSLVWNRLLCSCLNGFRSFGSVICFNWALLISSSGALHDLVLALWMMLFGALLQYMPYLEAPCFGCLELFVYLVLLICIDWSSFFISVLWNLVMWSSYLLILAL